MKDYLVTSDYGQWDNTWIVLAKNAKDAIEQVYQSYVVPLNESIRAKNKKAGNSMVRTCSKSELHAKSIERMHKEDGSIICVL